VHIRTGCDVYLIRHCATPHCPAYEYGASTVLPELYKRAATSSTKTGCAVRVRQHLLTPSGFERRMTDIDARERARPHRRRRRQGCTRVDNSKTRTYDVADARRHDPSAIRTHTNQYQQYGTETGQITNPHAHAQHSTDRGPHDAQRIDGWPFQAVKRCPETFPGEIRAPLVSWNGRPEA